MRAAAAFLLACAALAACASKGAPEQGPAPYAALVSPAAALKVVVEEVCLPAVLDGGDIEQLARSRYMQPMNPRSTGSPSATKAWRLASYSNVYVMALPDGGCSASIEAGSGDELAAAALAALRARRPDFSRGLVEVASNNGPMERAAYCTSEDRPIVAAILRKTGRGRRPAFLANIFRARADRPAFCNPS